LLVNKLMLSVKPTLLVKPKALKLLVLVLLVVAVTI
jgi:hypothetical protein